VSYQKVLNKSRNFSSRRKFSQTVFACREIKIKKKKKVREPPRSINWARAKTHDRGFALKLRVYDRVKHKNTCVLRNREGEIRSHEGESSQSRHSTKYDIILLCYIATTSHITTFSQDSDRYYLLLSLFYNEVFFSMVYILLVQLLLASYIWSPQCALK